MVLGESPAGALAYILKHTGYLDRLIKDQLAKKRRAAEAGGTAEAQPERGATAAGGAQAEAGGVSDAEEDDGEESEEEEDEWATSSEDDDADDAAVSGEGLREEAAPAVEGAEGVGSEPGAAAARTSQPGPSSGSGIRRRKPESGPVQPAGLTQSLKVGKQWVGCDGWVRGRVGTKDGVWNRRCELRSPCPLAGAVGRGNRVHP